MFTGSVSVSYLYRKPPSCLLSFICWQYEKKQIEFLCWNKCHVTTILYVACLPNVVVCESMSSLAWIVLCIFGVTNFNDSKCCIGNIVLEFVVILMKSRRITPIMSTWCRTCVFQAQVEAKKEHEGAVHLLEVSFRTERRGFVRFSYVQAEW